MPVSPLLNSDGVLSFKITSNGSALAETVEVVSVTVSSAINKIPSAEIVVIDGDMPAQTFEVTDDNAFKPGSEIEISAGYEDALETIFKGIVVRQGIRISGDNYSRLVVECRDKAVGMTIGRKNENYVDQTDSAIMRSLIGGCSGVTADVSETSLSLRELVQHFCTDWDFLLSRAEVNGFVVMVDQNKVSVKVPATGGGASLKVGWGESLIDFQADVESRTQLQSVKTVSWDPKTQAIASQTAAPASLNAQGNLKSASLATVAGPASYRLQTPVPMEQPALQKWADSQQIKSGLARIRGRMKFQGSATAKAGDVMTLEGVGARFSGDVYVSAVNHSLSNGNWVTEVVFGMSPDWFAERRDLIAPPASGLLPGIEGLHLGVVMKLDGDPAGENRVQVSIPLLEASKDGVWARLAKFYGSDSFGAFFVPEIGDEVVMGYLNNDPSYPVILGSLYSSKRKPPYDFTAENNTKAIVTRSKLRLIYDDEKKAVTIITPANNQIVVSDDAKSITLTDQSGNKAQLSPDGILLDSPKDIKINAKGQIAVSAVGQISISSKADVSVSGLNVGHTAQVGFTAKGSATAELSASGQTTVKGALVVIN
ncbi:MAG TPA: type VI secretion system tip protein VgrG [Bryobacteraceae bacterium]|jgi:Rhs element Vgr protein|nr:type VI secretion system tip protein VgrG [Bryobacteraceae bacterium]